MRGDAFGKEKMKLIFVLILIVFLNVFLMSEKTANLGEKFNLKKNETAKIRNADLSLKMLGNGQAQRESGGDLIFCKIEAESKNKRKEHTLNVGETAKVGAFKIKLQSVNTKADSNLSDPWSATSCEFIVTKN